MGPHTVTLVSLCTFCSRKNNFKKNKFKNECKCNKKDKNIGAIALRIPPFIDDSS